MKTRIKQIERDERKPAHVKKPVTLTGFINETEVAFIRATDWDEEGAAIRKMTKLEIAKAQQFGSGSVELPKECHKDWGGKYGYVVRDISGKIICYAGNGVSNPDQMEMAIEGNCIFFDQ